MVAEIADRTVVMYAGEQVETGTTDEIFRNAQKPYTKALLSAVPARAAILKLENASGI